MAKYKINVSARAEQDILSAYEYISQDLKNIDAADELLDAIFNKFDLVKDMPKMCPVVEFAGLKNTYRKCVVKNFIAFYVIKEEINEVYIARFHYGRKKY